MATFAKKLLVLGLASIAALALLEIGAAQLYTHFTQRAFDRDAIVAQLLNRPASDSDAAAETAQSTDPHVADQPVIIHPYFGYVANPTNPGVNLYGFFGHQPIMTRTADVALVAIMGGSVADQLVKQAGDVLADALESAPRFRDRRIELIDLALGGYKQPQQVLVLTTLLALGAQFDAVINVDGFNEIDGAKDNLQDGVNPYYPYTWNLHARQVFDHTVTMQVGKIDTIRRRREALRRRFARWPVPQSVFLLTLWTFLDQRQEAALRAETVALRAALARSATTPQQTGPRVAFPDDESMYFDFVEVWARASLEMAMLCAGHGIAYFQFLQPNQYLPGSKTLTAEERQVAYDSHVADDQRVATAYPMLQARGRDLVNQGVAFVDLTLLFHDETRSVYGDTCCHLNALGNQELAQAIGRSIAASSEPPAS